MSFTKRSFGKENETSKDRGRDGVKLAGTLGASSSGGNRIQMHIRWAFVACLTCAIASATAVASAASPSGVRIAAAADLRFALEELARAFESRHPEVAVKISYGSSGSFYAMIQNHAPFDLFFSADIEYPRKLAQAGLGADTNVFTYAIGRMAVWVPMHSRVDLEKLGMRALLDGSIRKIAIANPRHAPYGRAAEAALKSQGLYERVRSQLVYGENISQTLQFVQSGAADAGIIARSLAEAPQVKGKGRYWEVPLHAFPTMEQGGLILKSAKDLKSALAFREFVLSAAGRAVLVRHGFMLPADAD